MQKPVHPTYINKTDSKRGAQTCQSWPDAAARRPRIELAICVFAFNICHRLREHCPGLHPIVILNSHEGNLNSRIATVCLNGKYSLSYSIALERKMRSQLFLAIENVCPQIFLLRKPRNLTNIFIRDSKEISTNAQICQYY